MKIWCSEADCARGSSTEVVVPLRTISILTMLVAVKNSDVLRSVPPDTAEL